MILYVLRKNYRFHCPFKKDVFEIKDTLSKRTSTFKPLMLTSSPVLVSLFMLGSHIFRYIVPLWSEMVDTFFGNLSFQNVCNLKSFDI